MKENKAMDVAVLAQAIEQLPQGTKTTQIEGLMTILVEAERLTADPVVVPQRSMFAAAQSKIPFDEIFKLLKDLYSGKGNQYLQEIIDEAQAELQVTKKDPLNPDSARQLEIKITLAAAVIEKYADLLTMVIGKTHKDKGAEIIEKSEKSLKDLNNALDRIKLIPLITNLKNDCEVFRDDHRASHCWSLFCGGRTIKQIEAVETILGGFLTPDFAAAEIMGGLIQLDAQICAKVQNKESKNTLHAAIANILKQSDVKPEDKEQMSRVFLQRADMFDLQWPAPFNLTAPHKVSSETAMLKAG